MDEEVNKVQEEKPQGNYEGSSSKTVKRIPIKPHPLITNMTGKGEPTGFILTGQGVHLGEETQVGTSAKDETSEDEAKELKPQSEHPLIKNATGQGTKKWFILTGQSKPPQEKERD